MSDEGKKVGLIGGLIAALGGVVAHGADDCARVGAKGVAAEAAGVRAAGNVGDDLARAGTRVGGDLGRGALGGRLRGAPLVVPGAADDLGRVGARAAGFESEVGLAALGDEVAAGSKPWKSLAEELGQELSANVLAELLDSGPAETPAPPALDAGIALERFALVSAESLGEASRFQFPKTQQALLAALGASGAKVAVVVGTLHTQRPGALAFGGVALPLSTLHARAAAARATLWVLACSADLSPKEPCARVAARVLDQALETAPRDASALGRELVRGRDREAARALSIHGVARAKSGPRLVHSEI